MRSLPTLPHSLRCCQMPSADAFEESSLFILYLYNPLLDRELSSSTVEEVVFLLRRHKQRPVIIAREKRPSAAHRSSPKGTQSQSFISTDPLESLLLRYYTLPATRSSIAIQLQATETNEQANKETNEQAKKNHDIHGSQNGTRKRAERQEIHDFNTK